MNASREHDAWLREHCRTRGQTYTGALAALFVEQLARLTQGGRVELPAVSLESLRLREWQKLADRLETGRQLLAGTAREQGA